MSFQDIPIPDQHHLRSLRGARRHPVDLKSAENCERGVNILLEGIAGKNYYHSEDNPPYMHRAPGSIPELYVREGVLKRLHAVNVALSVLGYEIFVHDAYRPVEVQSYFHDVWVPGWLRRMHPTWRDEDIQHEVSEYWASSFPSKAEIDPLSPPPHATGAVVDLTLRDITSGNLLDMGSAFDAVDSASFADHFERTGETRKLTPEEEMARMNRRVLYHAMAYAGFVVNPNEWWHFGYGDQLSARNSDAPHAVYSVLWLDGAKGIGM